MRFGSSSLLQSLSGHVSASAVLAAAHHRIPGDALVPTTLTTTTLILISSHRIWPVVGAPSSILPLALADLLTAGGSYG